MQQHEAILPIQLRDLKLATFNLYWQDASKTALNKSWDYGKYLSYLCSLEIQKKRTNSFEKTNKRIKIGLN